MSSVNETEPVISLQHVSKNFEGEKGTFKALDDVSLEIRQGDIFGIIGYSGAGKSTLLRMINALDLNFPKNLHSNTGTGDYFPKKVISS